MQDDLDPKILQLLQKDSKLTYEQIGEMLNRSQSTIRDRIKKMEEDRTILGYSAIVDQERIGIGVDAFLSADIDPTQSNNGQCIRDPPLDRREKVPAEDQGIEQ
jgi:DNA-binding Lrp family transcriptional regulator